MNRPCLRPPECTPNCHVSAEPFYLPPSGLPGLEALPRLAELLNLEAWHHTRCGMTEDHREAAKAFVEKREPVFRAQ